MLGFSTRTRWISALGGLALAVAVIGGVGPAGAPAQAQARALAQGTGTDRQLRNPILPHADPAHPDYNSGADPVIVRSGGDYYLTYTRNTQIEIRRASTLAGLAAATPTVVWTDPDSTRCCDMWGPELYFLDGPSGTRWYVYYTAGNGQTAVSHQVHVLESSGSDPLGPYTYRGRLTDGPDEHLDGAILKKPDGSLYFLNAHVKDGTSRLEISAISNPYTLSGSRVELSHPTGNETWNEAPQALVHDGRIFLTYSDGCWCNSSYNLRLLTYTGGDVLDPSSWAKTPNPVFSTSSDNGVYGPGSNGFFRSPDGTEDWIVYHAYSSAANNGDLRTTRAQRFGWNSDGTPNFGTPVGIADDILPPSGDSSYEVQFEDSPVQSSSGQSQGVFSDSGDALVGGKATYYHGTVAGDYVTYEVQAPAAGTYDVRVRVKTNADRGTVRLTISDGDGGNPRVVGGDQDLYRPGITYEEVDFGTVTFAAAGTHRFRFEVTGRNPASTDAWLAFDQVRFVPAG